MRQIQGWFFSKSTWENLYVIWYRLMHYSYTCSSLTFQNCSYTPTNMALIVSIYSRGLIMLQFMPHLLLLFCIKYINFIMPKIWSPYVLIRYRPTFDFDKTYFLTEPTFWSDSDLCFHFDRTYFDQNQNYIWPDLHSVFIFFSLCVWGPEVCLYGPVDPASPNHAQCSRWGWPWPCPNPTSCRSRGSSSVWGRGSFISSFRSSDPGAKS